MSETNTYLLNVTLRFSKKWFSNYDTLSSPNILYKFYKIFKQLNIKQLKHKVCF